MIFTITINIQLIKSGYLLKMYVHVIFLKKILYEKKNLFKEEL
jgi:hypothetical protein